MRGISATKSYWYQNRIRKAAEYICPLSPPPQWYNEILQIASSANLFPAMPHASASVLLALSAAAVNAFQPGTGLPLRCRQELQMRACARCWIRAVRFCVSV
jgi:hypothetical protein